MDIKTFKPGDLVEIITKQKSWRGRALESYDSSVVLLKLDSGYNIGLRHSDIRDAKLLEKASIPKKSSSQLSTNSRLRNIAIIITGGTISSRLDPKSGGVISTDAEEILHIAPKIRDICNITKIVTPFMKWSENMSSSDWKKIALAIEKLLCDSNIDGVILTHGTDFLHYTASALAFSLRNLGKPVAITYSQRSIDRGSTDAALNLLCAAKFATSDIAEVAIIGHENQEDEFCLVMPATKTRKMHTSRRDAFKIINSQPLARISTEKFEFLSEFNARDNEKKVKVSAQFFEKVALIKVFPGQDPEIIDYYIKQSYKGLILETSGLGHVPTKDALHNWLPTLKKASKKITICAVAQTLYGGLSPNVYEAGRKLQDTGIIFLHDMLPETALVKLRWILGHKSWNKKIKEKLQENIAREFSNRREE